MSEKQLKQVQDRIEELKTKKESDWTKADKEFYNTIVDIMKTHYRKKGIILHNVYK